MKRRVWIALALAVSLMMVTGLCHAEGILAFEELSYSVKVGSTLSKKPVAQEIDGKLTYEWSSANTEIATVSSNGQVKGITGGETKIVCKGIAKDGTVYEASYMIEVIVPIKKIVSDVTSVTLTSKPWSMKDVSEDEILFFSCTPQITIEPENASNKVLEWSSSDPFVAQVNKDGVITAGSSSGNATITGKATDGSGKTVKIKVTVPKCFLSLSSHKFTELGETVEFAQKYTLGSGFWSLGSKTTGECVEVITQHRNDDSFSSDNVTWYTVKPVKAGTSSVQFICNGKVVGTVKFTVAHSAVHDNVSFPAKKIAALLKNVDGNIGTRTNYKCKIARVEEGENGEKVYGIVKEGKEIYYVAFDLTDKVHFSIDDTVTLYGEFSGISEYVTDTGLTYTCLEFTNGYYYHVLKVK